MATLWTSHRRICVLLPRNLLITNGNRQSFIGGLPMETRLIYLWRPSAVKSRVYFSGWTFVRVLLASSLAVLVHCVRFDWCDVANVVGFIAWLIGVRLYDKSV